MKKYKFILLSLVLVLISCKNEYVLDDIENVPELRNEILESEKYMKKIEVLPAYSGRYYAEFGNLHFGKIGLLYSILNYDPNDSIQEGHLNPNWQADVDTVQNIPGLNQEEWRELKCNLKVLGKYGIYFSEQIAYHDDKFEFYVYLYKLDKYKVIGPRAFLAVLSEKQTQTKDFKKKFIIMDKKEDLYLLISSDRN
ncbi:hypothetical protein [Bacteroides faecalis]|uniref:Uncharacterized protein n=1 Tax=Bacteroides faecalis TaxID=2447885 RepID=A0A401LR68_9BACE|nr:hypothetical protein [Bacteroides faecalis]GCB34072.1 hypothetical protein KGMB02408_10170 [Bacteroides faecalis]